MSATINVNGSVRDDYVAVNGGTRVTDRAAERGVRDATVTANVRRIRDAIANGVGINVDGTPWTPADGGGTVTPSAPSFVAWVTDTYGDDVAVAVSMAADTMSAIDNDIASAERAVATATARIDAANMRRDNVHAVIARMMPDGVAYDDVRTAYDDHAATFATTDAPTDDDATTDAPSTDGDNTDTEGA